jgi:hypothetical protein
MTIGFLMAAFPQITPILISDDVQSFFDYIEALQPGDVWVLTESGNIVSPIAIKQGKMLPWYHAFNTPGIKILSFSLVSDANVNVEMILRQMPPDIRAKKTYGVDFVYLGFIPGEETALAALFSNIRSVAVTDYYGTPLDQLPMMTSGHPETGGSINDSSAYTCYTPMHWSSNFIEADCRVAGETHGVPIIKPNLGQMAWSYYAPFYPHYIVEYYIAEHVVEYEFLIGYAGVNMGLYSTRFIWSAIFLVILGVINVYMLYERFVKRTGAS